MMLLEVFKVFSMRLGRVQPNLMSFYYILFILAETSKKSVTYLLKQTKNKQTIGAINLATLARSLFFMNSNARIVLRLPPVEVLIQKLINLQLEGGHRPLLPTPNTVILNFRSIAQGRSMEEILNLGPIVDHGILYLFSDSYSSTQSNSTNCYCCSSCSCSNCFCCCFKKTTHRYHTAYSRKNSIVRM